MQSFAPTGHDNSVNKAWRGLVTRDGWKYTCFGNTSWVLFNLNEDSYEQANLAHNNTFKAKGKKLIKRWKQWVADTGDPFAIPTD